jgi:hypothetical protein
MLFVLKEAVEKFISNTVKYSSRIRKKIIYIIKSFLNLRVKEYQ